MLFFELLQVAIGNREQLSVVPAKDEWKHLLDISFKQSLAGIVFAGIEKLPKEQWPDKTLLFQWMGYATQIEQRNRLTTDVCRQLCKELDKDGFNTCVLKGQANHAYYPKHLKNRRSCGDIDVWVVPKDSSNKHPVRTVIEHVNEKYTLTGLCHLHANIKPIKDVPVEVHFYPSFMNEPVKNRRYRQLFRSLTECTWEKETEDNVVIPTMKTEYDVIYQMTHIYRHLIDEGVGLRQVLDYYMLLHAWNQEGRQSKENVMRIVLNLGMNRFAEALMYVLKGVFAMPEETLLCRPSEKDGRFLLNEIMIAGNFGQSDPRMEELELHRSWVGYRVRQARRRFKRNIRFFSSYPEEVAWEPITRVSHYIWKRLKLWKY